MCSDRRCSAKLSPCAEYRPSFQKTAKLSCVQPLPAFVLPAGSPRLAAVSLAVPAQSCKRSSPRIRQSSLLRLACSEKMDASLLATLSAGFPSLSFDAQLRLVSLNDAARNLFAIPTGLPFDETNANRFFSASLDDSEGVLHDLEREWSRIVDKGAQNWENGLSSIDYWTENDGARTKCTCEGIVTSTVAPTNGIVSNGRPHHFSILLLRPTSSPLPSKLLPPRTADDEASAAAKRMPGLFQSMSALSGVGNTARLAREQLQTMLDNLPHICCTATPEGMITSFNKTWFDFTGLTEEESLDAGIWEVSYDPHSLYPSCYPSALRVDVLILHKLQTLFHPDDLELAVAAWAEATAAGITYNVRTIARQHLPLLINYLQSEYRILSRDKEWVHVVARGNPVRDESGKILSWVCTITEVCPPLLFRQATSLTWSTGRRACASARQCHRHPSRSESRPILHLEFANDHILRRSSAQPRRISETVCLGWVRPQVSLERSRASSRRRESVENRTSGPFFLRHCTSVTLKQLDR